MQPSSKMKAFCEEDFEVSCAGVDHAYLLSPNNPLLCGVPLKFYIALMGAEPINTMVLAYEPKIQGLGKGTGPDQPDRND